MRGAYGLYCFRTRVHALRTCMSMRSAAIALGEKAWIRRPRPRFVGMECTSSWWIAARVWARRPVAVAPIVLIAVTAACARAKVDCEKPAGHTIVPARASRHGSSKEECNAAGGMGIYIGIRFIYILSV